MRKNFIGALCFLLLVSACGGGGGGSKSDAGASSSVAVTITANAGADITVNEGTKVDLNPNAAVVNPSGFSSGSSGLEVTGTSIKSSDIVKIKWTVQQGSISGIAASDTTSGKFSFTAPDTGTASSTQITFQLTLTTAGGQTASDTITITVNRVNAAPVSVAGVDQEVEGETTVSLSGSASSDADGAIQSYAWTQTSGDAITLTDTNKATATFIAPLVSESKEYEFQLTVSDSDGVSASDKIIVIVNPKDAPLVTIYFPAPVGVYKESTISAFGFAEAVNANLSKVEISTGGDFVEATLSDGKWRLDNIAVPDTNSFEVVVKVTDSLGRVAQKKSSLKKSGSQGSGQSWDSIIALGIDNESKRIFAFADGNGLSDLRVFPIELSSGNRGNDISNFSQSTQGVQSSAIAAAHYDALQKAFYYTLSPSSISLNLQVNEIDVVTGQRKIISENAQILASASTSNFKNPAGITSNQQGQIFVADNGSGKIIRVEKSSGVRTAIASLDGVLSVAMDSAQPNHLFVMPLTTNSYVIKALLDVNPLASSIVTDSDVSSQGPIVASAEKMAVDVALNKLFLVDKNYQLFEANITDGVRTKINSVAVQGMGYDHGRHLMYYNDEGTNTIWVLDPVSKHKVMVSGSVD